MLDWARQASTGTRQAGSRPGGGFDIAIATNGARAGAIAADEAVADYDILAAVSKAGMAGSSDAVFKVVVYQGDGAANARTTGLSIWTGRRHLQRLLSR